MKSEIKYQDVFVQIYNDGSVREVSMEGRHMRGRGLPVIKGTLSYFFAPPPLKKTYVFEKGDALGVMFADFKDIKKVKVTVEEAE